MHLICKTTSEVYDYQVARLELSVGMAAALLAYRDLLPALVAHDDQFYCAEFFDYAVAYGRGFDSADTPDGDTEWLAVPVNPKVKESPVAASTVKVTRNGVLWSALPKHSDGEFETPEITWEQLKAVASGEDPFPAAQEEAGAETQGD